MHQKFYCNHALLLSSVIIVVVTHPLTMRLGSVQELLYE